MSDMLKKSGSAACNTGPCPAIRCLLEPVEKDLGGFSVRRLLPAAGLQAVGPFVFFDHLGPARFAPGRGIDVRPHPHIGLATITYLFEGEILHRDNLGSVQPIQPGAVNWMTAGRGIVHSERTPPTIRARGHTLHALQLWVALPASEEETDPAFCHYDAAELPEKTDQGGNVRVMIGSAFGLESPVRTFSQTLYAEVNIKAGAKFILPDHVEELGVYLIAGRLSVAGVILPSHTMAVFNPSADIELCAEQDLRLVIIGGQPLGKRTIWWNLVASRKELIEKAKRDWQAGSFPQVPGETEFIPLP